MDERTIQRRNLRDPIALTMTVRARVKTLMQFRAIRCEKPITQARILETSSAVPDVLTAYHELLNDAGMVIVPRERLYQNRGHHDDDGWED